MWKGYISLLWNYNENRTKLYYTCWRIFETLGFILRLIQPIYYHENFCGE